MPFTKIQVYRLQYSAWRAPGASDAMQGSLHAEPVAAIVVLTATSYIRAVCYIF